MKSRSLAATNSPEDELAKALTLLDQVFSLAQAGNDYQQFSQLFNLTNLRMFFRFEAGKFGKRKVQRLASGIITLGDAPAPIEIYTGNTGRHALKEACDAATKTPRPHQCGGGDNVVSDGDGNSLGNVSRGEPQRTSQGLYWYNLHLVLVHHDRWMDIDEGSLQAIRDMILRVSHSKGYLLSRGGILPDHVHLTLGAPFDVAPIDVALGFLNNLAFVYGMKPVYQYGGFIGTFGEYDNRAVKSDSRP